MTINDKLRHFYEITIAEAEKKANAGLDEHKKMLKEKINEHKRTMYRNAEAEVRSETEHASKEINIALANEKLTLRRLLSSRQTELEDRLAEALLEGTVKERSEILVTCPEAGQESERRLVFTETEASEKPKKRRKPVKAAET